MKLNPQGPFKGATVKFILGCRVPCRDPSDTWQRRSKLVSTTNYHLGVGLPRNVSAI